MVKEVDYLFVNPPTKGNTNAPNIGLGYIAAALKAKGKTVKIVDYTLLPCTDSDGREITRLKDRELRYRATVLGLSVKANTYEESKRITKQYLSKYPGTEVVWGGQMVTLTPTRVKEELGGIPNISFKTLYFDEEVMFGTGLTFGKDKLDELPFPDYSDFDSKDQIFENLRAGRFMYALITSRGCPEKCAFCPVPMIGAGVDGKVVWRQRSALNCYDELNRVVDEFGIKQFHILDDNFTVNKERVKEFCRLIMPLKLSWMCPNGIRADLQDAEMFKLMRESGCTYVTVGVESSSPEVLSHMVKGETIEEIEKGIKMLKEAGISVGGFFICGLPKSTFKTDVESYEWALKQGLDIIHFNLYSPYEGTPFWDEVKGNILGNYWDSIHFGNESDIICVYETPEYSKEERLDFMKKYGAGKTGVLKK